MLKCSHNNNVIYGIYGINEKCLEIRFEGSTRLAKILLFYVNGFSIDKNKTRILEIFKYKTGKQYH